MSNVTLEILNFVQDPEAYEICVLTSDYEIVLSETYTQEPTSAKVRLPHMTNYLRCSSPRGNSLLYHLRLDGWSQITMGQGSGCGGIC